MAEEASGQAPAQPAIPESLNPNEAIGLLTQILEAEGKPQSPRDEKGKFAKPEAKNEEAKPETEANEEKAEEAKPEEEQAEIQPEPRRFKLKYKGEELDKDESEVITLAQQGFDYTQKSQALAKERDELPAKIKAEVDSKTNAYLQQLEVQKTALSKIAGVKTMAEIEQLSRTDPATAQQEFLRSIAVNQAIAQIEAEQTKIYTQRQTEAQQAQMKQAQESVEKLQDKIPSWNQELYGKILKTAVSDYGFTQQEANTITDHRAIEVLNDARQWREYLAAKPKTVEKRVANVPKVQKPGTAQERSNPVAERFNKSMDALNKTGKKESAVDAVRMLIEAGRL